MPFSHSGIIAWPKHPKGIHGWTGNGKGLKCEWNTQRVDRVKQTNRKRGCGHWKCTAIIIRPPTLFRWPRKENVFFAVKACGTEMCQKLTTWDYEAFVIWNELDVSVKDNYICCHPALCLWRMDSIMLRFKWNKCHISDVISFCGAFIYVFYIQKSEVIMQ